MHWYRPTTDTGIATVDTVYMFVRRHSSELCTSVEHLYKHGIKSMSITHKIVRLFQSNVL